MIDTSKAVRQCVEELATYINSSINTSMAQYSPQPLFRWCDVHQNFASGTTTINGATMTNNDDGTFSFGGSPTGAFVTFPLNNTPITVHTKPVSIVKTLDQTQTSTIIKFAFPILIPMPKSENGSVGRVIRVSGNVPISINGEESIKSFNSPWVDVINSNFILPDISIIINGNYLNSEIIVDTSRLVLNFSVQVIRYFAAFRMNLLMYDTAELLNTANGAELGLNTVSNDIVKIMRTLPETIPSINMTTLENALYAGREGVMNVETNFVTGKNKVFDRAFKYYTFSS